MSKRFTESNTVVSALAKEAEYETLSSADLIQSPHLEVMRLVIPERQTVRTDGGSSGEFTVQCLRGTINFEAAGRQQVLQVGDLAFLASGQPHAMHAVENSVALVTICRQAHSH
ncbi:MAG: AraC family ligand binding domain-containing protein [Planctomycetaceae bacterium]|nr:AraC family ligand binding domain-containing protein [Planctomycetaceae bacterium]